MNVVLTALLLTFSSFTDQPSLVDISKEAPELQKEFSAASDSIRLVLIVSPG
jgi:hypothetical protein